MFITTSVHDSKIKLAFNTLIFLSIFEGMEKQLDLSQTQIEMITSQVINEKDIVDFLNGQCSDIVTNGAITIWQE